MWAIVTRAKPRGSWKMASERLWDDKEKALATCNANRRVNTQNLFAVVYLGDADLWKII